MKIKWINHASFLLISETVTVLVDPWFNGGAFNNGWQLIAPTVFQDEDYAGVTHIWFSHEHPDHFSPPTLKLFPENLRAKVTVLYQETKDRKVLGFCEKLGFKTRELPDKAKVVLNDELSVICGKIPFYDSWILFESREQAVLNLNDCILDERHLMDVRKNCAVAIDVLISQFSYANWEGNPDQPELRRRSADTKLGYLIEQTKLFKPRSVIPAASFIFFGHEENFYLNDSINTVGQVHEALGVATPEVQIVCLQPGESFEIGTTHTSQRALSFYKGLYDSLSQRTLFQSQGIDGPTLLKLSRSYIERMWKNNSRLLLWLMSSPALPFFAPFTVFLTDFQQTFRFSLRDGLTPCLAGAADVSMHSESLAYVFKFDWGFDTLFVNGRFRLMKKDEPLKVMRSLTLGSLNNLGKKFDLRVFFDPSLVRKALSRFF